MIISLVRLPDAGRPFDHQYEAGELDASQHEFTLARPPHISGRVERSGAEIRLRGRLTAQIEAPCDRCLRPVSFEIDRPFDLLYSSRDPVGAVEGEVEVRGRDLDLALYEGEEIDLDEMTLEQLVLSLPIRVLCREDCRGLCPHCGIDRNFETCDCRDPIDPRWEALKELQRGEGEEK